VTKGDGTPYRVYTPFYRALLKHGWRAPAKTPNKIIVPHPPAKYRDFPDFLMPDGVAVIFIWAFSPSPIEIGHIKANVNTVAFSTTLASTQRESVCEARGGFQVGFLEKTVSEFWSKYCIVVES
jgi:hypothetical protein